MSLKYRSGFTLIELLIVLAILLGLFAVLLPAVYNQNKRWTNQRVEIKIKQIEGLLEEYNVANQGYPTTEQGLYALIFVPDNTGIGNPAAMAQTDMGVPGAADPMAGGAVSVGPEMFNQPYPQNSANSMMTGGIDPSTGMPTDPMTGGGMTVGGGITSGWTQPVHNPQLYVQQRKRPSPYIENVKDLLDPWKQPYRYDNSQAYYGLNETGSAKPAIWSAGPDKIDGTDDDIRNWVPADAQQAIFLRQQQMQMQGSGMMPGQDMMMTEGMMSTGQPLQPNFGTGGQLPQPNFGTGQPPIQPNFGTGGQPPQPN